MRYKKILKSLGPGLLFASTAIGTSHLILSTRAGAHHGMIYLWIILITLILKYPFFEFGPRYTSATGYSLLHSYKKQGKWSVVLFMIIIGINMFAVTGALGAVTAGLLSTLPGFQEIPFHFLTAAVLGLTVLVLLLGRYSMLDKLIKVISAILLITMITSFVAVIIKGPEHTMGGGIELDTLLKGTGLTLFVSLIGFMPSGMESSVMHSIWSVEKSRTSNHEISLKDSLTDFNIGYVLTTILGVMFVTIGAFSVFGSGQLLQGSPAEFCVNLMKIFTKNLGDWIYPFLALAAFGTIYGTLIAAMDAFTRCFVRGLRTFKFQEISKEQSQQDFLQRYYNILLPLIGVGGFLFFNLFVGGMIQALELATIIAFLGAPVIAFLNLRAVQSDNIAATHRPSKNLIRLAYFGLTVMVLFDLYYILNVLLY